MTMYTNYTNSKILGNFNFSVGVVVGLAMAREAGCRFSSYQRPIKTLQVQDAAGRYPYVGCSHIMSGRILPRLAIVFCCLLVGLTRHHATWRVMALSKALQALNSCRESRRFVQKRGTEPRLI